MDTARSLVPYVASVLADVERAARPADAPLFVHLGDFSTCADSANVGEQEFFTAQYRLAERVIDAANVTDGSTILEVGCGLGGNLALLDTLCRDCRLVGLDIAQPLLEVARARVRGSGKNRFEWLEGNAVELPFPEETCECVLAVECAFHFPSRARFAGEAKRVLRPGGRLVLTDLGGSSRALEAARLGEIPGPVLTALRRDLAPYPDPWNAEGSWEEIGRSAGLALVKREDLTAAVMPSFSFILRGKPRLSDSLDAADRGVWALSWLLERRLLEMELVVLESTAVSRYAFPVVSEARPVSPLEDDEDLERELAQGRQIRSARITRGERRLRLYPGTAPDVVEPPSTLPEEPIQTGEPLYDYALLPYEPLQPSAGRIRSVNALYQCFALADVQSEGVRIVELLRSGLGPHRTVWGVKWHAAERAMSFEFYFYRRHHQAHDLSIEKLKTILSPVVELNSSLERPLPWHMFSVELGAAQMRGQKPTAARIYIQGSGASYAVDGRDLLLENLYTFHASHAHIEVVLERIRSSVHWSEELTPLSWLIPPQLFRSHHICVANKRSADAIYFSRIDTSQLMFFLERFAWPAALVTWASSRLERLAHLCWDVGYDFRLFDGKLETVKSGFYGTF